jgi:hypothetical protein
MIWRLGPDSSRATSEAIAEAMAEMRAKVWSRSSLTTGKGLVILDIDASLIEIHKNAAPTRRGQYRRRPRDRARCGRRSTPAEIATGHRSGHDADGARQTVVVRADSAGCTEGFLSACRARNVPFFVTARSNAQVTAAVCDAIGIDQVWAPALTPDGGPRTGASVGAPATGQSFTESLVDGIGNVMVAVVGGRTFVLATTGGRVLPMTEAES